MEQKSINIFLSISAFCCAIAFIFPVLMAELSFVGLCLFWHCVLKNPYTIGYKQALLWGTIFYLLYWHGIGIFLYVHAQKFQSIAMIFLLTYSVCTVMGWFAMPYICQKIIKGGSYSHALMLFYWIFSTVGYFWWVDTHFFWIFGQGGNHLAFPLLPLMVRHKTIWFVALLSRNVLLGLWVIAAFFVMQSVRWSKTALLALILLVLTYAIAIPEKNQEVPPIIHALCCIIPKKYCMHENNSTDFWSIAESIASLLDKAVLQYPYVQLFILPESAYPYALNRVAYIMTLWQHSAGSCVIGSHYQNEKNCLYNSLYVIDLQSSRIIHRYDKKKPLFFAETIPSPWKFFPLSHQLLLNQSTLFCAGTTRKAFSLPLVGSLCPYICSDIFMKKTAYKQADYTICLVNDAWFSCSYIPRLMLLHAQFQAIQSQQASIYVSYIYQYIITKQGNLYTLASVQEE